MFDPASFMALMQGSAGAGLAGSLAPAAAGATTAAAMPAAFAAPAAPALGSGMFGIQGVAPGVMSMGAAGPLGTGAVAQGTGPLLARLQDPATLDKLAAAPIDPAKIMRLLDEDGQQRPPSAPAPQGSRPPGEGVRLSTGAFDPRGGLSTFLGK